MKAICIGSSPSKGLEPVKISKAVMAAEYTSLRESAIPRETCSGERYETLPKMTLDSAVIVLPIRAPLAKPKSAILIRPSFETRMFSGFTSR